MPAEDMPTEEWWTNAQGHKVPATAVSETDRLIEDEVRSIVRHAEELMSRIARFRGHCFDDIAALRELLNERYGLKRGGAKGNISFTSFDGTVRVAIRVSEYMSYGPELQTGKGLLDEYIEEVSAGVADPLRALLNHAFDVDKPGKVNRAALYSIRRLAIDHPTFQSAVRAISDSMRVLDTKESVEISVRATPQDPWRALPINLANAREAI